MPLISVTQERDHTCLLTPLSSCDSKKDRCDGARPLCRVCKNLDRPCTYNRPERKRGPSQGVRQKLEGQIESLESVLGYMVEAYPHLSLEVIKQLRLDDAESAMLASITYSDPSTSSSSPLHSVDIYPRQSRPEARQSWRTSSLAKALAPSLQLSLGGEEEDDDMSIGEIVRLRIEEARAARSRLRSGMLDSPGYKPVSVAQSYQHQQPYHMQQPTSHHFHQVPAPISVSNSSTMQYQMASPGNIAHLPPYAQHQSPTRSSRIPQVSHSPTQHSGHPYQPRSTHKQQQQYQPQQHPSSTIRIDQVQSNMPYSSSQSSFPLATSSQEDVSTPTPMVPHLDGFGSSDYPNRFEEETEALAYALGLTTYSASPRRSTFKLPTAATPQSSSSTTWIDSYSGLDPNSQASSHDTDESSTSQQNPGIDFFSEYDLNMPSNNPALSVLHQLGLQGGFGMPNPLMDTDRIESNGNATQAAATSMTPTSGVISDAHRSSAHWPQPIRGIN